MSVHNLTGIMDQPEAMPMIEYYHGLIINDVVNANGVVPDHQILAPRSSHRTDWPGIKTTFLRGSVSNRNNLWFGHCSAI